MRSARPPDAVNRLQPWSAHRQPGSGRHVAASRRHRPRLPRRGQPGHRPPCDHCRRLQPRPRSAASPCPGPHLLVPHPDRAVIALDRPVGGHPHRPSVPAQQPLHPLHRVADVAGCVLRGRARRPFRRVVGWSIDSGQTAALATSALGMAIAHRSPLTTTPRPNRSDTPGSLQQLELQQPGSAERGEDHGTAAAATPSPWPVTRPRAGSTAPWPVPG